MSGTGSLPLRRSTARTWLAGGYVHTTTSAPESRTAPRSRRRPRIEANRMASTRLGAHRAARKYWRSNSHGSRPRTNSAPLRTNARTTGPETATESAIVTSASGRQAAIPSRSARAGASWPSPMSALRMSTRTLHINLRPLSFPVMRSVVLVTGGAGFIGSHVVDRLIAAGHRPRILDQRASPWHAPGQVDTVIGDVRRLEDVLRAAQGCTAICHLAAAADVGE